MAAKGAPVIRSAHLKSARGRGRLG